MKIASIMFSAMRKFLESEDKCYIRHIYLIENDSKTVTTLYKALLLVFAEKTELNRSLFKSALSDDFVFT